MAGSDEHEPASPVSDRFWWCGPSYIALYGVGCVAINAWTGFHVGLNDFWGNLALAEQVEWSSPESLYNQFFPIGYTVLLRLLGSDPVVTAQLLNVASGLLLLAVVWSFARRLMDVPSALAATVLLSIHPQVFRYVTTPGADMPAAALSALGFARLFRAGEDDRGRRALAAGMLLGAAALLRYHALVLAGLSIAATSTGHPSPRRHLRLAVGGFFAVYFVQMAVAVLAHHSPFHTGQAFILHKLIHGVNWFHVTDEATPSSVMDVIRASPAGFASAYLRELVPLLPLPIAPAALALFSGDRRCRRFGKVALLTVTGYVVVVATGGSSRGSLPIRFLVAISVVAVLREVVIGWRARAQMSTRRFGMSIMTACVSIIFVMFWLLPWARENYGTLKFRARDHAEYRRVEELLRRDGTQSARHVFASDFSLYFPTLPGYTPRTNGTWLRLDGDRYNQRFPELCVTTVECFVRDARRFDITHVVLTPAARQLSPALGQVYDATDPGAFEDRGRESSFRILRIR